MIGCKFSLEAIRTFMLFRNLSDVDIVFGLRNLRDLSCLHAAPLLWLMKAYFLTVNFRSIIFNELRFCNFHS